MLRSVQMWTELTTRLNPFTLLPTRAWTEGAFQTLGTAVATQRRYVDQVLDTQRRVIGQFLEAGATVATATRVAPEVRPTRN